MSFSLQGVGEFLNAIFNIVSAFTKSRETRKEEWYSLRSDAYKVLANHPALEHVKPPRRSKPFWEPFDYSRGSDERVLSQSSQRVFFGASTLADIGDKAKVIMLALWIIAQETKASKSDCRHLVSMALKSGLPEESKDDIEKYEEFTNRLAETLRTPLPSPVKKILDEFRSVHKWETIDFEGFRNEFNTAFKDKKVIDFDVHRGRNTLLENQIEDATSPIIAPSNPSSYLLMLWFTEKLYIGKRVVKEDDHDDSICWNAVFPGMHAGSILSISAS
ncbi:hypothetical protein DENSPDRAFT_193527 [Dentipellis sp. KUC8613]|nr:hypothetical protein DENSPDRAFT_193527 [Dentipellis sp. KUC8613]